MPNEVSPPAISPDDPSVVAHYEIQRVLGRGAIGVVYLARDTRIGREVALKTLRVRKGVAEPDERTEFLKRFRREAELSGALTHPNIVTLYEVGLEDDQISYLAMEYVEGESLLSLLRRNLRLPVEPAFKIAEDVLEALSYAHERGVIHRDIKPGNILIAMNGQAKIADFGIARSSRAGASQLTNHGQLVGTPHYMAPEHIAGRTIDGRCDLFSLGVVVFEMLTGSKPFEGTDVSDVLYAVVNRSLPSLSDHGVDVPPWCQAFINRMTAKVPDERYISAASALNELRRYRQLHDSLYVTRRDTNLNLPIVREVLAEETPTTPIMMSEILQAGSWKAKTVPSILAYGLLAVCLVPAALFAYELYRRIDDSPSVVIPRQKLEEFEKKDAWMQQAQALYRAGAYEQSAQLYREYLRLYPWSTAAQEGLRDSEIALESRTVSSGGRSASARTSSSSPSLSRKKPAPVEKKASRSLWKRIKSFILRT